MREAYRLEKQVLTGVPVNDGHDGCEVLFIAFLYRGRRDAEPSLSGFRSEIRQMLRTFVLKKLKPSPDGNQGEYE